MSSTMRAVAMKSSLPVTDPKALEEVSVPVPSVGPNDLLVRVRAVSVNPVDVKIRASSGDRRSRRFSGGTLRASSKPSVMT